MLCCVLNCVYIDIWLWKEKFIYNCIFVYLGFFNLKWEIVKFSNKREILNLVLKIVSINDICNYFIVIFY